MESFLDSNMQVPSFSTDPKKVIETPFRKIYVFEDTNQNIDQKTVESFGKEWKAFHQFTDEEIKELGDSYFDIVTPFMLDKSSHVLEVGCGSGRFIKYLSEKVGFITGVDPSEAVFAADELIGSNEKVRLVKASASSLPFENESFEFVYSIGVLHHIPQAAAAMKDCVLKLKKGGYFLTYIYYNLDNRSLLFRSIFGVANFMRKIISPLPAGIKKFVCDLMAIAVYLPFILACRLLKLVGVRESARKKIPLQFYEDKSFYIIRNDSLDRFGTPLEQRFSKQQIRKMMEDCGLIDIIFSEKMPFWHAVGRKV